MCVYEMSTHVNLPTRVFLTFNLAFLAVCDDEQTGGGIPQMEA